MKSILYLLLTIIIFAAVAFNANTSEEKQAKEQNSKTTDESTSVQVSKSMSSDPSLTKGIDTVLTSLDQLKKVTEEADGKTEKVNNAAEQLGEDWDEIEKLVEKKYPEDYEKIERSLYPLLAEAKKDDPDLGLVQQLLNETTTKVQLFKEMIGNKAS